MEKCNAVMNNIDIIKTFHFRGDNVKVGTYYGLPWWMAMIVLLTDGVCPASMNGYALTIVFQLT